MGLRCDVGENTANFTTTPSIDDVLDHLGQRRSTVVDSPADGNSSVIADEETAREPAWTALRGNFGQEHRALLNKSTIMGR